MAFSWLSTRACFLLTVAVFAHSIDPRLLRLGSRPTEAPIPRLTNDQLIDMVIELSQRVTNLEDTLSSDTRNDDIQHTLRIQSAQIDQLQEATEVIPRILDSDQRTEQLITELHESVREGCRCDGSGPDSGTAERGFTDGGWVNNLDRDEIRQITDGFSIRSHAAGRDRNRDDNAIDDETGEENSVELSPDSINALSRAFAQLITREVEVLGDHESTSLAETEVPTTTQETEEESPAQSKLHRPRPSGLFPFRHSRSLREPRLARADEVEEVAVQLREVFSDLLRASRKSAFCAIRTSPMMGINNVSQVINFQKVQTNKGKQMDRRAGYFNCTLPGIYYFSYTVRSYDDKLIGVVLMLNQDPVVAMTADASSRKVMQSQSVMLPLKKGDLVWLLLGPSEDFGIYGNKYNYITFNGVYLFK
ncbi:uncharacterized protein LOC100372509 [Saccoglossus kowalevskii]|uniref:Uncharacterized protein LOC100372509 n=1 Tax=Saccoglossus kowalevskii TaxID=10224 RepID=A0ABM0GKW1_SACKO|nr:PREDICTED: uncharacterized protein LOC100372509 [Saccoglossus kowalevskii]